MSLIYTKYALDEAAVETVSAAVQAYLHELGTERRSVQRIRLTVEELLLNILDGCGRGAEVSVGLGKQAGRHVLRLRYEGASFDPTTPAENSWADDLMRSLGVYPAWSYKGRTNTLSLILAEKKKRGTIFNLAIAVAVATALGVLGRFLPEAVRQTLDEALLTPMANAFLALMRTFSGLLIAFTVCSGIIGVGDSATLGKLGKRILLRFLGVSFLGCAAAAAASVLILKLPLSAAGQGSAMQLSEFSSILFGILPGDPVGPFANGNTLQIMVISLLIGIGLLVIGERGGRLRALVGEGATLLQTVVTGITSLIPLFVLVMLLRQIWLGEASVLLSIWKPIVMSIAAGLLMTSALLLWTALRLRCRPLLLLRKILPPFLIAFSTASSMAALTLSMETCETKLGVERSTVSFAFPLGSVIFKPASITFFSIMICCCAQTFHVEIGVTWLLVAVITITLLVSALPPLPGAGIMAFTVLFTRLGIPVEAMILVAAADVVIDFFDTGFNVALLLLQLARNAEGLGRLDRSALEAP